MGLEAKHRTYGIYYLHDLPWDILLLVYLKDLPVREGHTGLLLNDSAQCPKSVLSVEKPPGHSSGLNLKGVAASDPFRGSFQTKQYAPVADNVA